MNPYLELNRENEKDISFFITGIDFDSPHFHSNLELHYALEDGFMVVINGETNVLKKGELAIINSYDIHSTKGINSLCILIPYTHLTGLLNFKKSNPLNQNIFQDNYGTLEPIIRKFNDSSLHILKKKALIYELFAELYTIYNGEKNQKIEKQTFSYSLMRDIIDYVNINYSQKITLDDIVDKFKYSKSHVSHTINKYLNCNLNSYVNIVRLKNFVERMKTETEENITTVAYDCGFDSLQTFYRNFKSFYNRTPLEYIKKLKSNLD